MTTVSKTVHAILTLFLLSCSPTDNVSKVNNRQSQVFWPEKDMTDKNGDSWMPDFDVGDKKIAGSGKWTNRFYLNFDGQSVTAQNSFIVNNAGKVSVDIPAFSSADLGTAVSTQNRADVIKIVSDLIISIFAGIDVAFFLETPEPPFSTLIIGGKNFTGQDNVLGVAPLDIANFSADDILYAFSKEFSSSSDSSSIILLAHTAAHEIAHSLGARHIDDDKALLNPIVGPQSDDLNKTAKVVGEEFSSENSLAVLEMNVGNEEDNMKTSDLPEIKNIAIESQGTTAQFSVFALENFKANPGVNLAVFTYKWEIFGFKAEGPSLRVRFESSDLVELNLTVENEDGLSETMSFTVGREKSSE
jgi:hypothetical protein